MKVIWKPQAKMARLQIAAYILNRFGENSKKEFLLETSDTIRLLKINPYMASIDPLFEERAKTYRSIIINRRSKMVYYIEDETIYIAAFWDCRKDPTNQAAQVK